MPTDHYLYCWEYFPEYRAAQQYSRCLGRILASVPRRVGTRMAPTLIRAAVLIATGIAGAHAEVADPSELSREQREVFREAGLGSIGVSRDGLLLLKEEGLGSRPDLLAALELLERIESGLRARPLPGAARGSATA